MSLPDALAEIRTMLLEQGQKLDELRELISKGDGGAVHVEGLPPAAPAAPRRPVARPLVEQIESLNGPARDIAARLRIKRVAKAARDAKRSPVKGGRGV